MEIGIFSGRVVRVVGVINGVIAWVVAINWVVHRVIRVVRVKVDINSSATYKSETYRYSDESCYDSKYQQQYPDSHLIFPPAAYYLNGALSIYPFNALNTVQSIQMSMLPIIIGLLIGFGAVVLMGLGITLALDFIFNGIAFWIVFGAYIAVLVMGLWGAAVMKLKLGIFATVVMIFSAFIPLMVGAVG